MRKTPLAYGIEIAFSLLYNGTMNKKTIGIGSALLLGVGMYIGNQSSRMSNFERDEIVMRSKNLIRRLNRGEYDTCIRMFDSNLASTMDIERIKDIFTPTMEILGEFQRFKNTTVTKKELQPQKKEKDSDSPNEEAESESREYLSCTVVCQYKNAPATFSILFNDDHQICSIYLE